MSIVNIAKVTLPDGFMAGHGTVGTTEQAVSGVNFEIRKQIVVRADGANTSTVVVGRPGDAANGFILKAGEQSPPIFVDATDKVHVVGGAAGQNYSWLSN